MMYNRIFYLTFLFVGLSNALSQEKVNYQTPPNEILELLEAKPSPAVFFSKHGDKMIFLDRPDFLTIEEVSQPILGLAGLRFNPKNFNNIGASRYTGITIQNLLKAEKSPDSIKGLPSNLSIISATLSPDEHSIAFLNSEKDGVTLWVIDLKLLSAKRIGDFKVNNIYSNSLLWKDNQSLYVLRVPQLGTLPEETLIPTGPIVQENIGKAAPARTFQNLLKNEYDIQSFDYYMLAQLSEVSLDGAIRDVNKPQIYRSFALSPDGKYLMTNTIQKPYSYLVGVGSFPSSIDILDQSGKLIKNLYESSLREDDPLGFDSTVPGSRSFAWRPDKPSTVFWVEALDGGDASRKADYRDAVKQLEFPFDGEPKLFAKTQLRFSGISWFDKDYAVIYERWMTTRRKKQSLINSSTGSLIKKILDMSMEDQYRNPGDLVHMTNRYHRSVLLTDNNEECTVFTIGEGASPTGSQPFLMKWNLKTEKKDTLFHSKGETFEYPVFFSNQKELIISKESITDVPNYYLVNLKNRKMKAITSFPNPYPSFVGVQKQQVKYMREDSVQLTGTLYLPKDFKRGDAPLPLLMWAYPVEFKSADAAGQVKGSSYRFTRLSWGSPIYWANRGYAILDNADMPIIGEGDKEPNDTFIPQLKANAKAAIDYLSDSGYVDRKRVGVGGHSYGAFMTANLLAHTDLFVAGIARSGAYNRTFTPFGFQYEQRTYWQAPEVYNQMAPFTYANKIKTPILLIHGMDDENSGTFPIQSERFYNAIKGHGGVARFVLLPKEFHGYRAKESVMHTLWEMNQWLDKYVKNRPESK